MPPRVTQGAAYPDEPGISIGVSVTAGILAGTAAASIAYLLWSRRRRTRERGLAAGMKQARARLAGVRDASAAAQQALSAQVAPRARAVSRRGTGLAMQVQASVGKWRDQFPERVSDLGDLLGQMGTRARLTVRKVSGRAPSMPSATDVRETVAALLPLPPSGQSRRVGKSLRDLGSNMQQWVNDAADTMRGQTANLGTRVRAILPPRGLSWSLPRRTPASATPKAATQAVARTAKGARQSARRTSRRLTRRARWFRRGMLAGGVWGILYAPSSGRETRDAAAWYLSRLPYQRDSIESEKAGSSAAGIGGTGPHPRGTGIGSRSVDVGTHTDGALIQPTSEELLLSAPESDIGSLPGATPAL
jgi:gas vesicle protein